MRRGLGLGVVFALGCFEEPGGVDPITSTSSDTSTGTAMHEVMTTGSSSSTSADDLGTSEDSTTAAPDTTAATPVCGDGQIDGDELCDDGNDVPADGCTDCLPSLGSAWVRTFGTDLAAEAALSLSARPDAVVVAGALAGDVGDADLWLEVLDHAGESLGRVLVGGTADLGESATGVRFAADGSIWATGSIDDGGVELRQIDTRKLSIGLQIDWTARFGLALVPDRPIGIGLVADGAVVGGMLGNGFASDAWFGRYDAQGMLVDEYTCDCGTFGTVLDLATSGGAVRATVIDGFDGELWAFDESIADGPLWQVVIDVSETTVALDVALGGDSVVCGGLSGGNDVSVWLSRFDGTGDAIWTMTHDLGDGDQTCYDVVVDGTEVLAVGAIREDEDSARGFVARVDLGTGDLVAVEELSIESSADTRVLGVALIEGVPFVAGAYAVNAIDDDAFVARLVP